jgi:predicted nucleic acid-binding Zn ribbon protein
MTYIYACQTCGRLYEITCKMSEIDTVKPNDGVCDCGGELRRGIQKVPHIGEKVKGRQNNTGDLG